MRIWNLRRGDADDNRTSPEGRGLRGLLLSAVLEFNYLQAAIGFLALVIGPALLVGIMPSVVVTYGRLTIQTAMSAGDSLIVALVLLVVLGAAALWIGRPLLAMALDNFWHLHYTLVFPLFVALREVLRVLAEGYGADHPSGPARSRTPDRYRSGRPVLRWRGTDTGLFVEISFGLQLVDVEHVRVWAVVQAALGNAAVVLGLSTTVESLYWIGRELDAQGPGSQLGATPVECQRVSRARCAPVGSTCGRRALRLSYGGGDARPTRQPVHSSRLA